ncbi:hypothetical protein EVAR_60597_1 [Eumeta japonica]|uniref:Uncharacterized protein n=1 Tax=Eumeta variegata TaxID=151549 RepID=A0A4C1YDD8_EUMVA|nr:hypothetical protein EVAR_60597_1 [Eumeta japonica]
MRQLRFLAALGRTRNSSRNKKKTGETSNLRTTDASGKSSSCIFALPNQTRTDDDMRIDYIRRDGTARAPAAAAESKANRRAIPYLINSVVGRLEILPSQRQHLRETKCCVNSVCDLRSARRTTL